MKTSIETYTGEYVDYFNPLPEQIQLEDIARGLAHTCRFAGQTTIYYSVAEHAVRVHNLVREEDPSLAFAALHHDSHEAYLGDWPSPLKHVFDSELLVELAHKFDEAIAVRFGFKVEGLAHPVVKAADAEMLRREAATLKYSHGIGPHWGNRTYHKPLAGIGWPPEHAEREFIRAHQEEFFHYPHWRDNYGGSE